MYLSRLTFHTLPGKTREVEERLMSLLAWVRQAGGLVMRAHYGSLGAPDLIFEQEVEDPGTLETQIKKVIANHEFQNWAKQVSGLLEQSLSVSFTRLPALAHDAARTASRRTRQAPHMT
ncbi:MAG TPA: hypothetical protein VIE90_06440 [Candidatus Binatia bacterium]|jgi:hypothetical protein